MSIFSHICLHPSAALKKMEEKKGIVARFVIGRRYFLMVTSIVVSICILVSFACTSICSANRGDSLDRSIDSENSQTNDFFILVSC